MKVLCMFGMHHRLRRKVKHDGQDFVTVCGRCGTDMRRRQDGSWHAEPSQAEALVD